ncbi:hypothetical protein SAMN04487907_10712 [Zunongwangia mangrovi]|uniref:Uncharacterized protein n=1 Tax=Zunongwangia mangrovi TaxID=1334022 RepID=A0A1I1LBV9_9FLAO|nr:hypothetical protein [Zunongwangia mangrovi]SFC67020.1 hypothetical protein SAMN04487907_10712 [Zunongwangia mangrovi]
MQGAIIGSVYIFYNVQVAGTFFTYFNPITRIQTYSNGNLHIPTISNITVSYSGLLNIVETGYSEGFNYWIKHYTQTVGIKGIEYTQPVNVRSDYMIYIASEFPTTNRPQVNIAYSFMATFL